MSDLQFEQRNINADRICDGISRIGYRPHAAIADIVDNAISAGATEIAITIETADGTTLGERNNIQTYTVLDNGLGMTDEGVRTALDLGSLVSYANNSLSKYGLGLKSAGLSLGSRVVVLSKQESGLTKQYALDRDVIRDKQVYGICIEKPDPRLMVLLGPLRTGTAIQIQKTHSPQDSAATVVKNLSEQLGVIYCDFLTSSDKPLTITLHYASKKEEIKPFDVLIGESANQGFNPDSFDGKTPSVVANESLTLYDSTGQKRTVPIKAIVLPKDSMSRHAAFSESERAAVESYRVSRKYGGFFIYRNNRLIRWGDNLGIVGKDHYGFRARIDIQTEHDDLLHVDVSKQHLVLSEEFLDALKLKCRIPLSQMAAAFDICETLKNGGSDIEGQAASQSLGDMPEEDPEQVHTPPDPKKKKERRKKTQTESKQLVATDGDDETAAQANEFSKVRYTDKMKSTALWSAENDPTFGTFIRINRNHQFYQLIISKLEEASQARIAIELLLYTLAVGENLTAENLQAVDYEQIRMVLLKLRTVMSYNLESWAAHNQNLMG
jgi:hypothetical protein